MVPVPEASTAILASVLTANLSAHS